MSLPASIPAAILDTVLAHLASLFLIGAGGDAEAARQAALHLLGCYNIRNERELCLAAEIISFGLHSLESLSQADAPDTPLPKMLRLRGNAVSLNRECHRSLQTLQLMQQQAPEETAQPGPQAAVPAQPAPPLPTMDQAVEMVGLAREAISVAAKQAQQGKYGGLTYSQALQKRMTAQRMAEKAKRRAAEVQSRTAAANRDQAVAAVPA